MNPNQKQYKALKRLLISRASGMQSTKTNSGAGNTLKAASRLDTLSNKLFHRKCEELPYYIFLRVLVSKDLSHLIIEGQPSEQELTDAWSEILSEYSELIKTEKIKNIFNLWNKIVYTDFQITIIDKCIRALKMRYDEEIAAVVVEHGFELIEDIKDREKYLKQIYRVQTAAKSLIVLLNQYRNEYTALCPKAVTGKEATMAEYDKELAILSKFMGFRINKKKISVSEFCSIINLYNEATTKKS